MGFGLLGCWVVWLGGNSPTTQQPNNQNPRQQPTQQRHKKQKRQQGQKRQPNHPTTKLDGPAECAKRLNPPPLGRRLESLFIPVRTREGFPPLPSRRPCIFRRAALRLSQQAGSKSLFLRFFFVRILVGLLNDPKYHFFGKFVDFWSPRRRFSIILGSKTGPRGLLFRCFFKNGDFVEIVLPLWWEHSFQG